MKKGYRFLISLFYLFLFISLLIIGSVFWSNRTFGKVEIDQLLFTLTGPTEGTDSTIITSWIFEVLVASIAILIIIFVIKYIISRYFKKKYQHRKLLTIKRRYLIIADVCCIVISLIVVENNFQLVDYWQSKNQKTDIYEQKEVADDHKPEYEGDKNIIYKDSHDVAITGEETNNLIYIYLESYENTFADKANGGYMEENCLPELTQLAKENISFSNTDKLGGALAFTGTTWTIASMVSQLSGIPLKVEAANNMDKCDKFMPGARMIGDVLAEKGYSQHLLIGSDATFAGTDKLFKQHGNYNVIDSKQLKRANRIKRNEHSYWGLNDAGLFRIAKEELAQIASTGEKFNFTMATIDCHTPNGIECDKCPDTYKNKYHDIYACQSRQVSEFIEWCKVQSWYPNTTIVIVGDHNTMAVDYVKDVPADYVRTTYNCIINSKATTLRTKNRKFCHLDMFPTTLAAMGFEVEGNKLGLGTNLFSGLTTTIEQYGQEYIENEVSKSSDYLEKNIYQ